MMAFIHIVNPELSFALAVAFMATAILATVVLLLGWWNDPPTRLPRRHSRSLIVLVCVAFARNVRLQLLQCSRTA